MTELDFTKYRFVSHDVETNYNLGIVNLLNVQYIKNVTKQDTFKILFFLKQNGCTYVPSCFGSVEKC